MAISANKILLDSNDITGTATTTGSFGSVYKVKDNTNTDNNNIYALKKINVICETQKNLIQIGTTSNLKIKNMDQVELFFSNENKKINNFKDITNKITLESMQDNLESALSPENNDWQIISKIARRTFVPESEESRIKGAGGGDAND